MSLRHAGSLRNILVLSTLLVAPDRLDAQTPDQELEQVLVTGSRIARRDFESASPIVSIDAEAFERTGALSVEAVVGRLPQFVPYVGSSSNERNRGQGNLQLRGLGATSTLVLVDGRRLTPANGNGVVDVNIIPGRLIESVEVIAGGASAVYGSDAIAGVANFKLLEKFHGVRFDGGWGQTDRSDGAHYEAGLTAGTSFASGRGEVFGHVGYAERESIFGREREISAVELDYFGPGAGGVGPDGGFLPVGPEVIAEGLIAATRRNPPSQAAVDALFASYGYAAGAVQVRNLADDRSNGFSVNADGSVFSVGNGDPGSVVNFRGERDQDPRLFNDRQYSYNIAPWYYLEIPLEQVTAFAHASFELGPEAELYGQALYGDYTADAAVAPSPAWPLFVPSTNPYIPADLRLLLDSRPDPTAVLVIGKRTEEVGPRVASHQHDAFQLTLGSRGRLFGDWDYDAYLQTGSYDSIDSQTGHVRRSKIMELTSAPDGGLAACGGLDLFGPGSISAECAQYIAVGATNRDGYDQKLAEVSLTGTAVSLPSGDLKIAVGVMHKHDAYFYRADPLGAFVLDDGFLDINFGGRDDIDASDHNTDIYAEAVVPLLNGVTGVERLEVALGYRHSEYASAGGVAAYKAELLYDPVRVLTLRSSFQHAVRAPSVFELYQPLLPAFWEGGVRDPCAADSDERIGPDAAQVEALCLAQGVPAEQLAEFVGSDETIFGVYGGNPDLGPETGDTLTAGFVLRSWSAHPLLSSMQFSLDWYSIAMDDAIAATPVDRYITHCFDVQTNPQFDADYKLCRYFSRDAETGQIVDLAEVLRNDQAYDVSGIDGQFDWGFALGPGEVGMNVLVSWMDTWEYTPVQGVPPEDAVGFVGGFFGGSLPEWKWNLNLSYAWGGLTIAGQWRYIDGMDDRHPDWPDYEVPSYEYLDLNASYDFEMSGMFAGLRLWAGIENLTDEDPPLLPSGSEVNTDTSQYDLLGRRYFVGLKYFF